MQQAPGARAFGTFAVWLVWTTVSPVSAQDSRIQLRVDIAEAERGESADGEVPWSMTLASAGTTQEVLATVVMTQNLAHCAENPSACDGSENVRLSSPGLIGHGCIDGADNNGNGLVDGDDPDCQGITAWTIAVATDDCFSIAEATTEQTVADPEDEPLGLRDPSASFEKTELANPIRNAGQEGAVSSVVLSFVDAVVLPQQREHVILRLRGDMDISSLSQEGDSTGPCALRIRRNSDPLKGSDLPIGTSVCLGKEMFEPQVSSSLLTIRRPGVGRFIRGDCDSDGEVAGITDAIVLLGFNFLGTDEPPCLAACDVTGDGAVTGTIDDAITLLNFFFQGGEPPVAPFPDCGPATPADLIVGCSSSPEACR